MYRFENKAESILGLSAKLIERNRDFTKALKEKRPQTELRFIHSEIQELYNQLTELKQPHLR